MFTLFVYGTIGDPEFFEYLLKRKPSYQKAQLENYQLFINRDSGYLFVKPSIGKVVWGKLVEVTEEEFQILDIWEDVPFYERELVSVKLKNKSLQAFVYTQNDVSGIPIGSGLPNDRNTIFNEIKAFRKWIDEYLSK